MEEHLDIGRSPICLKCQLSDILSAQPLGVKI